MDLEELKKIIEVFKSYNLSELEFQTEQLKVYLSCNSHNIAKNDKQCEYLEKTENSISVFSPVVGKIEFEENVCVGTRIKKGEKLFSVEAMKMINHVESHCAGVIECMFAKSGELVQFEQEILRINRND